MDIHYFQRYQQRENVDTANAMLLLERLYRHSSDRFYRFLDGLCGEECDLEPRIVLQPRESDSIPDAEIRQRGLKVVVETKRDGNSYSSEQLIKHARSFRGEDVRILLSMAPTPMKTLTKDEVDGNLPEGVRHINVTFQGFIDLIQGVLDERDQEMADIVEDYVDYCRGSGLLPKDAGRTMMKMQLATRSYASNKERSLYYCPASRGFAPHDYIGLYWDKSIRLIGKVSDIIVVSWDQDGNAQYDDESCDEGIRKRIEDAAQDALSLGWNLKKDVYRFFLVDGFHKCNYRKTSKYGAMGSRNFDLAELLEKDPLPDIAAIADGLSQLTWQ